uniref:Terminase large subunit n=1 Tax=Panagrellus redivivus TaxID=6233 RepID=A0A7E4VE79_PANRE
MARLIHPGLESCAYWARNMELTQEDCDVLTKMLLEYVAIPDRRFLCRSINGFDAFFEEFRPLLENNPEYRVYGDDDGFYIAPIN